MVDYVFRTSADGEKIARSMLPWGDPEDYCPRLHRTARNPKAPRWRVHDQDFHRTQVAHCS